MMSAQYQWVLSLSQLIINKEEIEMITDASELTTAELENLKGVYKLHLVNNDLEDDSDAISSQDILDYVNEQIDEEDKEWYGLFSNLI
jgi:ribosomal protein S13